MLRVPHRLALVIQHDIARLEALHITLFGLRLRADEATHRQRRGGGRLASRARAIRAHDQLGLSAESDLARRLVPRGFPKVEPTCYGRLIRQRRKEKKRLPYKLPACLSDRVRYMRVAPIELFFWFRERVRVSKKKGHDRWIEACAYVKMTWEEGEELSGCGNVLGAKVVIYLPE